MEMRRAIARPFAARATAKSDGFPIQITAIGETAVAASEFDQRKMPWNDLDAAQLHPFDALEYRPTAEKLQRPEIVGIPRTLSRPLQLFLGHHWRRRRPVRLSKAHSPRPSERRIAGISGAEPGINGVRGVPVRHSPRHKFLQRLAMRGRPACWFHRIVPVSVSSATLALYYDMQNTQSSDFSEKRH
jgi:hypothetical protein